MELTERELNQTFRIALLLTGNMRLAEAAVMSAIRSLNTENLTEDALVVGTVRFAARFGIPLASWPPVDPEQCCAEFPISLQRVMKLTPRLRYCFVSRILAGLSLQVCASLLQIRPQEVFAHTCAAAETLANMQDVESGRVEAEMGDLLAAFN